MQRRKVARAFKLEAVRWGRGRGVTVAQAASELVPHDTVRRKWVKQFASGPGLYMERLLTVPMLIRRVAPIITASRHNAMRGSCGTVV